MPLACHGVTFGVTLLKERNAARARALGSPGNFWIESSVNNHRVGLLAVAGTLAATRGSLFWPDSVASRLSPLRRVKVYA
jgi:hypothetical protein